MSGTALRIATRASRLALWQANHVAELLRAASGCEVELVHVSTTGDRDRSSPLSRLGSVGVFTRAIQQAVLDGEAEVAVHSLKDLPTEPTPGLLLAAVPQRGPRFDALVLPKSGEQRAESKEPEEISDSPFSALGSLPSNARVGTGSPRRRAQLLHQRDDLELLEVRGNVETRLKKLDEGQYEALVLAEAGLKRLDLQDRISAELRPPVMYPAVGQGALGLECRDDDEGTRQLLQTVTHPATQAAVTAERTLLAELRAGCHAPLGVFTALKETGLTLEAVVLSADGQQRLSASTTGELQQPQLVGKQVAEELFRQGAERLIAG